MGRSAAALVWESAAILRLTREWVKDAGVEAFHDMQGICHIVLPEMGHLRPGMFVAGGDSHSTTGGAFGAFMMGMLEEITEAWLRLDLHRTENTDTLSRRIAIRRHIISNCLHGVDVQDQAVTITRVRLSLAA